MNVHDIPSSLAYCAMKRRCFLMCECSVSQFFRIKLNHMTLLFVIDDRLRDIAYASCLINSHDHLSEATCSN